MMARLAKRTVPVVYGQLRLRAVVVSLMSAALVGCLSSAKPARMPDGTSALRIECNYTVDNCHRRARSACDHGYTLVSKGDLSCKDCGWELDSEHNPQNEGNNVYKGVLYVRCR
ncbi:MAG: hypothetical protein RLZZ450_4076 [Pseudomonadota bacterium]|jgi:hypothetical protein